MVKPNSFKTFQNLLRILWSRVLLNTKIILETGISCHFTRFQAHEKWGQHSQIATHAGTSASFERIDTSHAGAS